MCAAILVIILLNTAYSPFLLKKKKKKARGEKSNVVKQCVLIEVSYNLLNRLISYVCYYHHHHCQLLSECVVGVFL